MNHRTLILVVCIIAVLLDFTGCEFVKSFSEMNEKVEILSAEIEKSLGTKPMIGWNIQNNRLVELNVYFDSIRDERISVGALRRRIRKLVTENMEEQPERLLISLSAKG